MNNETYLGDGLYASFDGWQFCLRTPRGDDDHVVYLEPGVLAAFQRYIKEARDNYDPTPYCSAGHADAAHCDCGPIADNE